MSCRAVQVTALIGSIPVFSCCNISSSPPPFARVQTSESKYVKKLKAILNAYLSPLRDSRVLTSGEVAAIFRCIPDMKEVHNKLNGVIQTGSEDDNVLNGVAVVANEFML